MAPLDADFLVLGHESLGRVTELDRADESVPVGQLAVVTIRRPGRSVHDHVGRPNLSTDPVFIEIGISQAHGFMAQEVVADAYDLVPVPEELQPVAILT